MTARDPASRAQHAISLIDLTDLADDRSDVGIGALCERALAAGTAAVCVWPEHVARCAGALSGSGVGIATVVNFPTGSQPVGDVVAETETALDDGATEIDLVLPYTAFLAGDVDAAATMITAVRDAVASSGPPRILKLILETGELVEPDTIRSAAQLGIDLGADFVKTSTGKTSTSARPESVGVILDAIAGADRRVGIKPSGGIRTYADAVTYLDLAEQVMGAGWITPDTFRFGASGLLDALQAVTTGSEPAP